MVQVISGFDPLATENCPQRDGRGMAPVTKSFDRFFSVSITAALCSMLGRIETTELTVALANLASLSTESAGRKVSVPAPTFQCRPNYMTSISFYGANGDSF